jgi:hypothetical protein
MLRQWGIAWKLESRGRRACFFSHWRICLFNRLVQKHLGQKIKTKQLLFFYIYVDHNTVIFKVDSALSIFDLGKYFLGLPFREGIFYYFYRFFQLPAFVYNNLKNYLSER